MAFMQMKQHTVIVFDQKTHDRDAEVAAFTSWDDAVLWLKAKYPSCHIEGRLDPMEVSEGQEVCVWINGKPKAFPWEGGDYTDPDLVICYPIVPM